MKKIGIWLAVVLLAFGMTAPCALAKTAVPEEPDVILGVEEKAEDVAAPAEKAAEKTTETGTTSEKNAQEAAADEDKASETTQDAEETAADTEETEEETEEAPAEPAAPPAKAILNAAELIDPQETGNEELDALVQDILGEVITEDMDTYGQVLACYDYLTDNMRYSWSSGRYATQILNTTSYNLFSNNSRVNGYGALALATNSGQCNDYASGFILLVRALGVDANLVKGQTVSSGGGYMRHYWAEISIDGTRYVFDPQLDQSLSRWNGSPNSLFCKTYKQVPGRYIYSGRA